MLTGLLIFEAAAIFGMIALVGFAVWLDHKKEMAAIEGKSKSK